MQKSIIYSSQHTYLCVVTKCLFLPWTPHETISQHYALDGSDPLTSFLASLNYSCNCVPWTVSKRGASLFPASHLTGWCSLVNWFGKCWSRIYLSNLAIRLMRDFQRKGSIPRDCRCELGFLSVLIPWVSITWVTGGTHGLI